MNEGDRILRKSDEVGMLYFAALYAGFSCCADNSPWILSLGKKALFSRHIEMESLGSHWPSAVQQGRAEKHRLSLPSPCSAFGESKYTDNVSHGLEGLAFCAPHDVIRSTGYYPRWLISQPRDASRLGSVWGEVFVEAQKYAYCFRLIASGGE